MIYGIIDLGSNTIRLSVYDWSDGDLKLLLSKKSIAGLLGYVEEGVLSAKGIDKACSVLGNFKSILESFKIVKSSVFATASLRNIANTGEVVDKIAAQTGFRIDLLSGEEEARLDFLGAIHCTELQEGLLADIGGGSTELVLFRGRAAEHAISMPVGSLSLSLKYVPAIIPDKTALKKIKRDVSDELGKVIWLTDAGKSSICGVGGSMRAARKLYNDIYGLPSENMKMESDKFFGLITKYRDDGGGLIKRVLQLSPDRVNTIIPGMVIISTILKRSGCSRIVVSTCGVREGYFFNKVLGGAER